MNYKISLTSRSYSVIDSYMKYIVKFLNIAGYKKIRVVNFPIKKNRITLLRSPHVNKASKEQFEIRKYVVHIFFSGVLVSSASLKYLFLNKPKSLVMKLSFLEK